MLLARGTPPSDTSRKPPSATLPRYRRPALWRGLCFGKCALPGTELTRTPTPDTITITARGFLGRLNTETNEMRTAYWFSTCKSAFK